MSRYIDADKLVSVMCHHCTEYEQCTDKNGSCDDFDMLMIAHAPTADVVDVKRGKWINERVDVGYHFAEYDYECSICGGHTGYGRYSTTPYCPWCGADMRGEYK